MINILVIKEMNEVEQNTYIRVDQEGGTGGPPPPPHLKNYGSENIK